LQETATDAYAEIELGLREAIRSASKTTRVACPKCSQVFSMAVRDWGNVIRASSELLDRVVSKPSAAPQPEVEVPVSEEEFRLMSTESAREVDRAVEAVPDEAVAGRVGLRHVARRGAGRPRHDRVLERGARRAAAQVEAGDAVRLVLGRDGAAAVAVHRDGVRPETGGGEMSSAWGRWPVLLPGAYTCGNCGGSVLVDEDAIAVCDTCSTPSDSLLHAIGSGSCRIRWT